MKITGAKKVHYDSGPNMTPLVDVVMVILIFLMLAGSFGGVEHYLVSNAGFQTGGTSKTPPPPNFIPPVNITVRVDLDPDSVSEAAGLEPSQQAKAYRYQANVNGTVLKGYAALRRRPRRHGRAAPVPGEGQGRQEERAGGHHARPPRPAPPPDRRLPGRPRRRVRQDRLRPRAVNF